MSQNLTDVYTVKKQLQIQVDDHDERIQMAIEQASSLILNYCHVEEFDPIPPLVAGATIAAVKVLIDDIGADPLNDGVKNMLYGVRDPTMA